MTPDLAKIAVDGIALSEKVTAKPWYIVAQYGDQDIWNHDSGLLFRITRGGDDLPEITDLIVHACNNFEALAKAYIEARAEIERLQGKVDYAYKTLGWGG